MLKHLPLEEITHVRVRDAEIVQSCCFGNCDKIHVFRIGAIADYEHLIDKNIRALINDLWFIDRYGNIYCPEHREECP